MIFLRVDSPFFLTIVLLENRPFPWVFGVFFFFFFFFFFF